MISQTASPQSAVTTTFRAHFPASRRSHLRWLIPLLMSAVLWSCSPFGEVTQEDQQWSDEYAQAMRLDPIDAEEKLADLIARAPTTEQRRSAEFDRARIALKRNDAETARLRFQELWDEDSSDNVASRALYELGRLAVEYDDDIDEGRRLLHQTIVETPPWAGSELALQFLVRTERNRSSATELVDHLAELAEQTDDDRMASQIHLERGLTLNEILDRPDDALDAFRAAYMRCHDCAATDEGLYQMGRIYADHQQWGPATSALAIVADRTDESWFIGSYHSQRAADARYLMGRIEMLYRSDYDAAADHFQQFLDTFGTDHPDAARVSWHLVSIERLRGAERSYRRALEHFIDDYPDSRYADDARSRLAEVS